MGSNPTKAADNIYCKCRKTAAIYNDKLFSREGAAELLGLSSSTLASYELGSTKVIPVDKVVLMADLYNAPEILNNYCATECPIGYRTVPQVKLSNLDRAVLKMMYAFKNIEDIESALLDIMADGVISDSEKPQLEVVMSELEKITAVVKELQLSVAKYTDNRG